MSSVFSNYFQPFIARIGSIEFVLLAECISCAFKLYLLTTIIFFSLSTTSSKSAKKIFLFLIIFLGCAISGEIIYIIRLLRYLIGYLDESRFINFLCRFAWSIFITQHQSLAIFLGYLADRRFRFGMWDIINFALNLVISTGFIYLMIFKFNVPADSSSETFPLESRLVIAVQILFFPIFIPTFYRIIKKLRENNLPKILHHQLRVLLQIIGIYLFLQLCTNKISLIQFITTSDSLRYALISISTLLSSFAIFYCARRMLGLRFLNFKNHVESRFKFDFINDFIDILEQLASVTTIKELAQLTQAFFKAAFRIPLGCTRLYVRRTDSYLETDSYRSTDQYSKVENFILNHDNSNCPIATLLKKQKIFIKDEIEFTNFYEENSHLISILEFMDSINADIFVPIYERQLISGYIIVERNARPAHLYSNIERDEMLVYGSYMGNIINILKHGNLDLLLQKEKELQEELYQKHQEINQYKESIRSFLRTHKERKIGIVFYKNRKFTIANQAAQDLIGFDLHTNEGHPLTQALKTISRKVLEYKSSQSVFARDNNANKLILSGIPSLEPNTVITLLYYPEVSDLIQPQFEIMKDPSKWDYLLYLETTTSGQLINQLIPGSSETLLQLKFQLLETSLSKKATLLQMPEDDLMPTVELLHHISLRQTLHVLKLSAAEKNDEVAIKLFGINALFSKEHEAQGLLEKLDSVGTLFIENIHFLNLETQNYLAEFLSFGFFHRFKTDQKVFSAVRIIASTNKNLQMLVTEGQFSKKLFNELNKMTLTLPSLMTLPKEEINQLVEGFTQQALKTPTFKNLLELTDKEKTKLLDSGAESLQDFKAKVHQLLVAKSTKHNVYDTTQFDPAYHISDPELSQAVRLGKNSLKDPQIMELLWNKFRNQNKIATLLGVNRSSVNRRCREYKLL